MKVIKVIINGVAGKMGLELVRAFEKTEDIELVGGVDVKEIGEDIGLLAGLSENKKHVYGGLPAIISEINVDVIIDLTNPNALRSNMNALLDANASVIIGTSGIDETMLENIQEKANKEFCVLIAPNFALGAVLMMKCAGMIAEYMDYVEIIELHHDGKLDAPSATAIKTAEMIYAKMEAKIKHIENKCIEKIPGARGCIHDNIRIHSVRLPGLVAHQEVIFGGLGQTLTIRHDSLNRESFMPGILYAIRKVNDLSGVIYGLENLL